MSSIETQLGELNTNIKALTAAILTATGGAAAKPAAEKPAANKPAADKKPAAGKTKPAAESSVTKAQMQAALNDVKEALGTDAARKFITDAGFAKMNEITEDKYEEIYNAAKAALEPQDAPGADLDGDDGL